MMLLLFFTIFVVVVFILTRVAFWCLERLWLCVVWFGPSRVRVEMMIFVVVNVVFVVVLVVVVVVDIVVDHGEALVGFIL